MLNLFKNKKKENNTSLNNEMISNDELPYSKEYTNEQVMFEVKGFNFYYDKKSKLALKDINLEIFKNKVTAFIGPSGCGKSTLLRCFDRMNELIQDSSYDGQILYKNKEIHSFNTIELRSKVGMVFQQPNPFPMSIYNNVAYGPKCQGLKDKKELDKIVLNSLKDVGLYDEVSDRLNISGSSLSGGQQQRLCIARCIAMSPDVILMDEPTSALDPIATQKIEELIKKLKEKYTIIIVTHNMQQAARISDYTAFFMLGELVEFNKTEEFFARPINKKSEDYITGKFS